MPFEEVFSLLPDRQALPRGRSALPESEVEAFRRGRILQAVIDEVAEFGYAAANVAGIIKRARVSRTSFYEAFADKEEAFSAAYEDATALIASRVWEPVSIEPGADFASTVRSIVAAYVTALENSRSFTISFYVEIRGAGERLLAQRAELLDQNVENIHQATVVLHEMDPSILAPGPDVIRALLGGLDELVSRSAMEQRNEPQLDLQGVVEPFLALILAVMHDTWRHAVS